MAAELVCIAKAAGADISAMSDAPSANCGESHQRIADALKSGERAAVFLLVELQKQQALRFPCCRKEPIRLVPGLQV